MEFNDSVLILQSNMCDIDLYGQKYSITFKKMVQGILFFTVKTDIYKQTGKSFQAYWLFTKESGRINSSCRGKVGAEIITVVN